MGSGSSRLRKVLLFRQHVNRISNPTAQEVFPPSFYSTKGAREQSGEVSSYAYESISPACALFQDRKEKIDENEYD